jgi:predicted PurR-regulated permease PerM
MAFLATPRDRAGFLIFVLGAGIFLALTPFVSGLLGAAVLYVIFVGWYRRLAAATRPALASGLILIAAVLLILLPLTWLVGLVVGQAPDILKGVAESPLLDRLVRLPRIGTFDLGAEIAKASGTIVRWVSSQALGFLGGAASASLNVVIAFFGFYYMLRSGEHLWGQFRDYVPFSSGTADALREHFYAVTRATLLGTVAVAAAQGALVGLGFLVVGLPNPLFWGTMTAFASILPVLGSGLVWIPATLVLVAQERYGAAIVMVVVGWVIASNVDNLIRPLVYRRAANIHPMITLVGAFAGIKYFGLPGLLLGPLAIAYFFELLYFYRKEFGVESSSIASGAPSPAAPAVVPAHPPPPT